MADIKVRSDESKIKLSSSDSGIGAGTESGRVSVPDSVRDKRRRSAQNAADSSIDNDTDNNSIETESFEENDYTASQSVGDSVHDLHTQKPMSAEDAVIAADRTPLPLPAERRANMDIKTASHNTTIKERSFVMPRVNTRSIKTNGSAANSAVQDVREDAPQGIQKRRSDPSAVGDSPKRIAVRNVENSRRSSGRFRVSLSTVRGAIGVPLRVVGGASRAVGTVGKINEKSESSVEPKSATPTEYAHDNVSSAVDSARRTATYAATRTAEWGMKKTVNTALSARRRYKNTRDTVKVMDRSAKEIKEVSRGTVKTANASVKTADTTVKTAKVTAKTSSEAAKAAAKSSAEAAKATYKAAQVATKMAAKAAAATAKAAAKAASAVVNATTAFFQAVVGFIAAGGWIVLIVILAIAVIVALTLSVFGIFFSGSSDVDGLNIRDAIMAVDEEYRERLSEIQADCTFDFVVVSGTRSAWREVLAVYTVKVAADPNDPQSVASVDDEKIGIMKNIFWQMTEITYYLDPDPADTEETVAPETDPAETDPAETEPPETEADTSESDTSDAETTEPETEPPIYLYITVTCKSIDEIASELGFNENQIELLTELLSSEYDPLWDSLLAGVE